MATYTADVSVKLRNVKIEARSEARMQEVRDYLNKEIERTLNVTS